MVADARTRNLWSGRLIQPTVGKRTRKFLKKREKGRASRPCARGTRALRWASFDGQSRRNQATPEWRISFNGPTAHRATRLTDSYFHQRAKVTRLDCRRDSLAEPQCSPSDHRHIQSLALQLQFFTRDVLRSIFFPSCPWLSEALPVPRSPWYHRLLLRNDCSVLFWPTRIVLFRSRSTGHLTGSGSRDAHDLRQSPCPSRPVLPAFPFFPLLRRNRRPWRWPFLRRVRFVDRGLLRVHRHFWIDNGRGHY